MRRGAPSPLEVELAEEWWAPRLRSGNEIERCADTQESNASCRAERSGREQFLSRRTKRDEANASSGTLDDLNRLICGVGIVLEIGWRRVSARDLKFRNSGREITPGSTKRSQRGSEKIDRKAARYGRAAKRIYQVGPRRPL